MITELINNETEQMYFEAVQDHFLELCEKYELPKPEIISLSEDTENYTKPPNLLQIAVNLNCSPRAEAQHLFGHWVAGLHEAPHEDLVADTIANMVQQIENKVTFSI